MWNIMSRKLLRTVILVEPNTSVGFTSRNPLQVLTVKSPEDLFVVSGKGEGKSNHCEITRNQEFPITKTSPRKRLHQGFIPPASCGGWDELRKKCKSHSPRTQTH